MLPHDFYSMDIDDAALMYQGWGDELLYQQQVLRKATLIIAEVVNKTMGGKGIMKNGPKMWPLPGDSSSAINEKHHALLKQFKEMDAKNGVTRLSKKKMKVEVPVINSNTRTPVKTKKVSDGKR